MQKLFALLLPVFCFFLVGCETADNTRIPNYAVNISLETQGIWNSYGVHGAGMSNNFIFTSNGKNNVPSGFIYNSQSRTGFGGVLLVMDNFMVPLAFDLACPVERKADVRVKMDSETHHAVCNECGSVYDVTMLNGLAISGPAALKSNRYELRNYNCIPSNYGGYRIVN